MIAPVGAIINVDQIGVREMKASLARLRWLRQVAGVVLACIAIVSCRSDGPSVVVETTRLRPPGQASTNVRVAVQTQWDTLAVLIPTNGAKWQPLWIASSATSVYVFDQTASRLLGFDASGHESWVVGDTTLRYGRFENVRDVRVANDGKIWILDSQAARITVVQPNGKVERQISIDSLAYTEKVIPLGEGRFVALTSDDKKPFVLAEATGRKLTAFAFPWVGYAKLPSVSRFGSVALGTAGEWSFAFANGDGWFVFDSAVARPLTGHFVERVAFPAVITQVEGRRTTRRLPHRTMAALSTRLHGDTLYVLFGGDRPDRGRRIDLYDARSGAYQGTWGLPFRAAAITASGSRWAFMTAETDPHVVLMRRSTSNLRVAVK